MYLKNLLALLMVLVLFFSACGDDDDDDSASSDDDDDEADDDDETDDDDSSNEPTNAAMVFQIDPIATPDPIEVDLQWVADDAAGTLTSAETEEGYRLIQVYTCLDEGKTNNAPGIGEQRICTLVQRASKEVNGDFVYTDWDNAINGVFDDQDIHAEVSLYYHAQKMYSFLIDDRVGLFDRLPGRHEAGQEKFPLNLVANYRYPSTGDAMMPISMSFYIPREHMEMGMSTFMGVEDISGDCMMFGQGSQADFAYDGETIYHEFGHMINTALADMSNYTYIDQYGLSNIANVLEQGLSETYTFLVSGKSNLFLYIDQVTASGGFSRDADNDNQFPKDIEGIDQFDGMIVAGANWEAYQWLIENYGFDEYDFGRVVMQTEMDMNNGDFDYTLTRYAQSFLSVLEDEGAKGAVDDIEAIFTQRGMFETERAKDLADCGMLFFGGAYDAAWNDTIPLKEEEETVDIGTAFVQCYYDVPAGQTQAVLSAHVMELSDSMGMYPETDDWDLKLFVRSNQAVIFTEAEGGYEVAKDETVEADSEAKDSISWTLTDLTPGERVYLHPVNYGDSQGALVSIGIE